MKRWWFRVARVLFALGVGIHLKILLLAANHSARIFTEKEEYESGLISEIIPSDTTTTTRGTIIKNNTTSNKGNEEIETGKPDIALHNRAILVDDMDAVKEQMLLVFKQLPFLYKLVGDIGSAKPFLAGKGTPWQRVYYHAETKGIRCPYTNVLGGESGTILPASLLHDFDDYEFSVGPILPSCAAVDDPAECDANAAFLELDSTKALLSGEAFRFQIPTPPPRNLDIYVLDRTRVSGATGVQILKDGRHLITASFEGKEIYLYEFLLGTDHPRNSYARLLDRIPATGNCELVAYDATKEVTVIPSLHSGSVDIIKIDFETKRLIKYKTHFPFRREKQKAHGSAIYPDKSLTVAAASAPSMHKPKEMMVRMFDYESGSIIASLKMHDFESMRGQRPKDLCFLSEDYLLVDFTTITVQNKCFKSFPFKGNSTGHLGLFKLSFSAHDIVNGKRGPANSHEFEIVDTFELGISALDGITCDDWDALVVDQAGDKAYIFHIDVTAEKPIQYVGEENGYRMPHGAGYHKKLGMLAMSSYGENSITVRKLSPKLREPKSHILEPPGEAGPHARTVEHHGNRRRR